MKDDTSGSAERVALDLAHRIFLAEKVDTSNYSSLKPEEARKYWFTLYEQSLAMVHGQKAEDMLLLSKSSNE